MWKDKLIKMKENMQKGNGNSKRKIENIVVFIIILMITIIVINQIWNPKKGSSHSSQNTISNGKTLAKTEDEQINSKDTTSSELETNLESILSKIEGVGNVKVLVTYSESSQTMAMYNEDSTQSDTQESDKQGGNRKVSQVSTKKEVIYQEVNGEKVPVTQSVVKPKVEGAIITATGAADANVKTNIIQAVEAVTGLATHKIQVFEMKH
ncbi:MAG: hypothetical protein ACLU84_01890 [Clostridia bacterium]